MIAEEYAGFWLRLGAYFIDAIILGIIGWGVGWIVIAIGTGWGAAVASSALGFTIGAIYFVSFWTWRGQTPGKMIFGVKVIRTDGSKIGGGRAFLRYVGYIICEFTFYIGFIWVAFDRNKQGIHDRLADTCVIKMPGVTRW